MCLRGRRSVRRTARHPSRRTGPSGFPDAAVRSCHHRGMKKDTILRQVLVAQLTAENAHVSARRALSRTTPHLRGVAGPGGHSVWELLEHMRLAQEDILRYTLDRKWKSPAWP